MHALSPREGPVESIFNFIQSPLGVLWQLSILGILVWKSTEHVHFENQRIFSIFKTIYLISSYL